MTVGENSTISCISDLSVQRVEWVFSGGVIVTSSGQQADLTFLPVQEFLHNREYTCRAVTAYGTQERRITITVQGKLQLGSQKVKGTYSRSFVVPSRSFSLSIVPMGNPVAGTMYNILCMANLVDGIQSTPIFTWLDSNGSRIMSGNGINIESQTTNSLPLEFNILRGSHSGNYTCRATLFSLALQMPLVATTSTILIVQSKLADVLTEDLQSLR